MNFSFYSKKKEGKKRKTTNLIVHLFSDYQRGMGTTPASENWFNFLTCVMSNVDIY